jgi:hypothetical protein
MKTTALESDVDPAVPKAGSGDASIFQCKPNLSHTLLHSTLPTLGLSIIYRDFAPLSRYVERSHILPHLEISNLISSDPRV